jgi:hypothetical protein
VKVAYEGCRKTFCEDLGKPSISCWGGERHRACRANWPWLVNNQAFAAFPSMAIGQEYFAVILFFIAIVGIAFAVLVVLFLMFRNQHRDTTKTPRRFLHSNWK